MYTFENKVKMIEKTESGDRLEFYCILKMNCEALV